jgi:hypothetical protein
MLDHTELDVYRRAIDLLDRADGSRAICTTSPIALVVPSK